MRLGEATTPYLSGIANPTTVARAPQHAKTAAGSGGQRAVTRLGEVYDPYVTGTVDRATATRRAPHAAKTTQTAAAGPVTRLGAEYDPYVAGTAGPAGKDINLWDHDGFSFGDLVDMVNPLQHIPVVSSLYRALTKDDIGALPRVVGGALYGGVIGAVASLANVVVNQITGRDVGGNVIAMITGDDNAGAAGAAPPGQLADKTAASAAVGALNRTPVPGTDARRPAMTVKPWINPDTVAAAGQSATQSARAAVVPNTLFVAPKAASSGAVPAKTTRPGAAAGAIVGAGKAGRPGTVAHPRRAATVARPAAKPSTKTTTAPADDKAPRLQTAPKGRKPVRPPHAVRAKPLGRAPRRAGAGPWIPETMQGALDKYQRLLRQRQTISGKVDLRT